MTNTAQGTNGWLEARLGKVTASRIGDLMARTKTGWGASRKNYEAQLIAERLTGSYEVTFKSAAMERGLELEVDARTAYEFHCNVEVKQDGFVNHPTIAMSGASPDGFVGDRGLIEIKCPNSATHLSTLLNRKIETNYVKQMQWQMDCSGRDWCDYVSYDPRMPAHLQLYIQRVPRDSDLIQKIKNEVIDFLSEIDRKIENLSSTSPTTTKFRSN